MNAAYKRQWEKDNPERVAEYMRNWRAKQRAVINTALAGGCVRCGETDTACLDFHHRNPAEKEAEIGNVARRWGSERLLAEIAKCVVLCSNCHRKFHAGRFTLDEV
jgi:5-methylcytosine-specific restriction endonuclease McrA